MPTMQVTLCILVLVVVLFLTGTLAQVPATLNESWVFTNQVQVSHNAYPVIEGIRINDGASAHAVTKSALTSTRKSGDKDMATLKTTAGFGSDVSFQIMGNDDVVHEMGVVAMGQVGAGEKSMFK
eukprot:3669882-Rhodomonas_salina.2